MSGALKFVFVVPALNESATIARVVASLLPHGAVVVVDDGSKDGTADRARDAGADVVVHAVNRGYDGAIRSGFERAIELGADAVISFDADGQHDASVVDAIVAAFNRGAEVVIGVRSQPARISEHLFGLYTRVRFGVPDILCGLKGFRRETYLACRDRDRPNSIHTGLALAALRDKRRCVVVDVPIHPRLDRPRFGSVLRANGRILRAMLRGVQDDVRR